MEASAIKHAGTGGLHARSPLLRLQSDERLVALTRRGNQAAFEALVRRYEARLLSFCRHLLGSREDAEDVLQDVFAAAFSALHADDRPIQARPWLYRIARNRSLNHLRRVQAVGVDSMDVHFSDHGASTADKVHNREEFRLLVRDIQQLPEQQRAALLLREMEALPYEQIADVMETTVPSVKSLLVRARVGLAEAAEARLLSCDEVRIELGELAEGLRRRPSLPVRRHLKGCERCSSFRAQLKDTNLALAAVLPIGPLVILKKFVLVHLGHSAGAGSGATAAGSSAAGSTVLGGGALSGFASAGIGAVATKAAAGLAAAALVTAGAVEVDHAVTHPRPRTSASLPVAGRTVGPAGRPPAPKLSAAVAPGRLKAKPAVKALAKVLKLRPVLSVRVVPVRKALLKPAVLPPAKPTKPAPAPPPPGRIQTQTDETVLPIAISTPSAPPPPVPPVTTPSPAPAPPIVTPPPAPPITTPPPVPPPVTPPPPTVTPPPRGSGSGGPGPPPAG